MSSCFYLFRFVMDTFPESYEETIGLDFAVQNVVSPNHEILKLQVSE